MSLKQSLKEMDVKETVLGSIKWVLRTIPLILSALIVIGLLGSGLAVGAILRSFDLEMGFIVLPSLIVQIVGALMAYQFVKIFFFPKEKKTRDFDDEDDDLPKKRKSK